MPTVADSVDAVVGGDTHVDTVTLHMTNPVGAVISELTIDNDPEGHDEAIQWVHRNAPGDRILIGLEGTGSYGASLTRAFQAYGLTVVEVERPKRGERGRRGKSDPIDAKLAAYKLLRMDAAKAPQPRAGGDREALRLLVRGRDALNGSRTRLICQLLAVLLTGDADHNKLRKGDVTPEMLQDLTRARARRGETSEQRIRRQELHRMAQDILSIDSHLKANEKEMRTLVKAFAPVLLERRGVGAISAAQVIVSWSHPGRCRDHSAFAALGGISPIPASSGRSDRHRLNRGGDRKLNRAVHTIVLTRWRDDERTKAYIQRRRAEHKTDREIRRALKRYIARELFNLLNQAYPLKINNAA